MADFDDELNRRLADMQTARARGEAGDDPVDAAFLQAATALADALNGAFKTDRVRFAVAAPGEFDESDEDDDANPYRVSVWSRDFDGVIGLVSLFPDDFGFEPDWDSDAADFLGEVNASDRTEFVEALMSELADGLARFIDAQSASDD
ncbi:MAG: hypothetical protein R3C52_00600 [Hyphomonadaceae bacterium]